MKKRKNILVFIVLIVLISTSCIIYITRKNLTKAEDSKVSSVPNSSISAPNICDKGYRKSSSTNQHYYYTSNCDDQSKYMALCYDPSSSNHSNALPSSVKFCQNVNNDNSLGIVAMYQSFMKKNSTEAQKVADEPNLMSAIRVWLRFTGEAGGTNSDNASFACAAGKIGVDGDGNPFADTTQCNSGFFNTTVDEYLKLAIKNGYQYNTEDVDSTDYEVEISQTTVSDFKDQGNNIFQVELTYEISGLSNYTYENDWVRFSSLTCPADITCESTMPANSKITSDADVKELTIVVKGTMDNLYKYLSKDNDGVKFTINWYAMMDSKNINEFGVNGGETCGSNDTQRFVFIELNPSITSSNGTGVVEQPVFIPDLSFTCEKNNGKYILNNKEVSFSDWIKHCCENVTNDDLSDDAKKEQYIASCPPSDKCDTICTDSFKNSNTTNKNWCKDNCYKCETPSTSGEFNQDAFNKNDCCDSFPEDDPRYDELCPGKKCEPEISKSSTNTCNKSEIDRNVYIHESDYYEQCIIDNQDANGNSYNISTNAVSEDNAYCVVSCKEDYDFYLPTNRIDVKAGTYFFLNAGITGKRTCVSGHKDSTGAAKTGSNLEQFKKDLYGINSNGTVKDGNIDIDKRYSSSGYSSLKTKLNAIKAYSSLEEFRNSKYASEGLNQLLVDAQDLLNMYNIINDVIELAEDNNYSYKEYGESTVYGDKGYLDDGISYGYNTYKEVRKKCDGDEEFYSYTSYYMKGYYKGTLFFSKSATGGVSGSCKKGYTERDGKPRSYEISSSEFNRVESAVKSIKKLIAKAVTNMQECSNWDNDVTFDFAPEIDYWYEENDYMSQVQKAVFERKTINKIDTSIINTKEEPDEPTESTSPNKKTNYCDEADSQYSNCTGTSKGTIDYIYVNCDGQGGTECSTSNGTMTASVGTKVVLSQSAIYWPKPTFYTLVGSGGAKVGNGENYDTAPDDKATYLGHVFPVSIGTKSGNYEYRLGFYNIGMSTDGTLGRIVKKVDPNASNAKDGVYSLYNTSDEFDHACGYSVKEDVCDKCVTYSPACINCTTSSEVTINSGDNFSFRPVSPNNLFPNSSSGTGYLDIKTGTDTVIGSASDSSVLKVSYNAPINNGVSYEVRPYNGSLGTSLDKKKVGKNWANKKGDETIKKIEKDGSNIYENNPDYSFELTSSQMAELKNMVINGYENYTVVEMDSGQKEYISEFLNNTDGRYFTWDPDPEKPSLYGFNSPNGPTIRTDPAKAKTGLFQSFPGWSESNKDDGYGPSWK